jgi:hypothetical protein
MNIRAGQNGGIGITKNSPNKACRGSFEYILSIKNPGKNSREG